VAEIVPALPVFATAPLLVCPPVKNFASFPRLSEAAQFPGFLYLQKMVGISNPSSASRDAGKPDDLVLTPEHGNQTTHPVLSRDSLHDAVFARSVARFSLTEEDDQPDDSSVAADIENLFQDCLPIKAGKSFARAIDAVHATARYKKD
jgi:hypothetical protein